MHRLPPEVETRILAEATLRDGPFYLYDRTGIARVARSFLAVPWPDKSVHFATMANDCPGVLAAVREAGLHVFVNSLGHLDVALGVGFTGAEIVFTASALDERTMRRARETGATVNLDSPGQVAAWRALHKGAPFGIRCNIGELIAPRRTRGGYFLGRESRLGLTLPEIRALEGSPDVEGLHLYVGTDILDLAHFEECYRHLAAFAPGFPGLRYLDFGGGFGVPADGETFDFEAFGRMAAGVMHEVSRAVGRGVRLVLEPGRIVAAEAGHFACRVVDVKLREGRQLLGVNASAAQFPRPLLYPDTAWHPVSLLGGEGAGAGKGGAAGSGTGTDGGAEVPSDVCGCSTYSRDYLARDVHLPPAAVGDVVVFGHAGAYCASSHTSFLGFPRAPEILA
ncbi:MAG: hypothetical protein FJ087_08295 [Deltaproteobacteria bacterium]|nr:hypothetical protein [Deltaproteobacteria bacterium]